MATHTMATHHLLLIDDEESLLNLMDSYLKRLNYTTEKAADATHALSLFRTDPARFHLVVTDLSLPDLKGDKLAVEMHALNPSLKILLCSGYPFEIEQLPEGVRASCATLQKPWLPKMLAQAIADLLKR